MEEDGHGCWHGRHGHIVIAGATRWKELLEVKTTGVLAGLLIAAAAPPSVPIAWAQELEPCQHVPRRSLPEASIVATAEIWPELLPAERRIVGLYAQAYESVVGVSVDGRIVGSGFIWDDQGHIVTNAHVVSGGGDITVRTLAETSWLSPCVGGSFSARWGAGSHGPGSTGPEYAPSEIAVYRVAIDEVDNFISITVSYDHSA